MNPRRAIRLFFLFLSFAPVWVCAPAFGSPPGLSVFVSIIPQKYFVQKIGGRHVTVAAMVRPGANPATYEPRPSQMAALASAQIYFAIGVPFEKAWMKRIATANPRLRIVATQQGIKKMPMATFLGESKPRRGGILDPHIWLSPRLVKIQSGHIARALAEADPMHRSQYQENYRRFAAELDALDSELKQMFAGRRGMEFMVFHPSWGYFARDYGLRQVPVEIEGKTPKPARLKELIEHARRRGIRLILVQPQFSRKSAELIARAIGARVVTADPLAEDWAQNLRRCAAAIQKALK